MKKNSLDYCNTLSPCTHLLASTVSSSLTLYLLLYGRVHQRDGSRRENSVCGPTIPRLHNSASCLWHDVWWSSLVWHVGYQENHWLQPSSSLLPSPLLVQCSPQSGLDLRDWDTQVEVRISWWQTTGGHWIHFETVVSTISTPVTYLVCSQAMSQTILSIPQPWGATQVHALYKIRWSPWEQYTDNCVPVREYPLMSH